MEHFSLLADILCSLKCEDISPINMLTAIGSPFRPIVRKISLGADRINYRRSQVHHMATMLGLRALHLPRRRVRKG